MADRSPADDRKAVEERMIGIESTFSYQDERIRKLEEVVSQQQLELHELRTALDLLAKAVRPPNPDAANEKPPHY